MWKILLNGIGKNYNKTFIYLLDLYIYMKKLKKFVKKLEKYKKSDTSEEKDYLKNLVKKERKGNKKISIGDLAKRLYYSEKEIQKVLNEIDSEEPKKIEKKPNKIKKNKEFFKKNKEKLNNIVDKEDKKTILQFLTKVLVYGIPLNFSLFIIFGIKFNYYSFFGWGIAFWFIKEELVDMIRGLWMK